MRNSQTHRSLSHKRVASCNQSIQNSDIWDNIGLINSRLTPLQQLKGNVTVYKKYQGDKLLQSKIKYNYDDSLMLPTIDYPSTKVSSIVNQSHSLLKKQSQIQFPNPIKREIKSDKIKLLVMLSQLRKEYQKELKPTQTVCLYVQEVLEILQKQDNIYGDDMKNLFVIINEMIFCVQQDVIECVQSIQSNTERKLNDTFAIKPYFEYIKIMKDEIEKCNKLSLAFKKEHENDLLLHHNLIKQNECNSIAVGESQKKEILSLQLLHQEETNLMLQKIDNLNEDLQRAIKENTVIRDSLEKWKLKFEDVEKRLMDQIILSNEYQGKYLQYKSWCESNDQQIEIFEVQLTQIMREKQALEEQLSQMTPKPNFNFHNIFGQMGGIDNQAFEFLSSNDKVEFIKEKMEEKMSELAVLQENQNNKKMKKKGSRILGVFAQTKTQITSNTNLDEKYNSGGGSQKSLEKSPTRRNNKGISDLSQNSPTSPTRISSKDKNSNGVLKRNMKKSQTVVTINKNKRNNNDLETEGEDSNTPFSQKLQMQSQVNIHQSEQIPNFSSKTKQIQSEERRVQFKNTSVKSQTSESEYDSPQSKQSNRLLSNLN